ncbi:MAG: hypothetical protein KAS93_06530 [Gammaproteobacteria bacterium]|nr:hypothetical protein [Gammaproteobacteria bacterium]
MKTIILTFALITFCTPLFAANTNINCNLYFGYLQPTIINAFQVTTPGYSVVRAKLPLGYSWGGGINLESLKKAETKLICVDADQFFKIEDQNGNYCILYSSTEYSNNYVKTFAQHGITCNVATTSVVVGTNFTYYANIITVKKTPDSKLHINHKNAMVFPKFRENHS